MNKLVLFFSFLSIFVSGKSQTVLLSTDFQQGIPNQYSLLDNDNNPANTVMTEFIGQNAWIVLPDPENPTDTVAAATSFFETADSADRWLITPQINLAAFGNFISWNAKSHDPSFPDDYLVLLSTTDNQPASFTDTIGNIEQENFEWTNREVNLSTLGYNDSSIYVAFVLRTYDGFKLYLDDISVRGEDPLGITGNEEIQMVVYPNPTSDLLHIQSQFPIEKVQLFCISGELLKTELNSAINISEFAAGSYLIQVSTAKGITSRRISKVD
jgi:hypothetical protein